MMLLKAAVCLLIISNSSFFFCQTTMWLELSLLFIVIVCFCVIDTVRPKDFPPGPRWLPVVGNLFLLARLVKDTGFHHLAWARLAALYGPVVGVRLGQASPIVFVSGYDAVHDVLRREEFDGRPDGYMLKFRTMGKRRGVVFADGEGWKEHRRFFLRTLRDFGFGKRSMEGLILGEAESCMKRVRSDGLKNAAAGVPMQRVFVVPVLNTIWSMVAGTRFEFDDPELGKITQMFEENFRNASASGAVLNHFPQLRHIAPNMSGFASFASRQTRLWTFFSEIVWEHKKTISDVHSRDVIDVYLKELEYKKKDNITFKEMELVASIKDLFAAGSETTSNTLSFAMLYLLLHPHVQRKAQQEIDKSVGFKRLPTLEDRREMPYVNAVIMEVQRCSHVAAFSIGHRAVKDTYIAGYSIPKDTTVLMSLYSLHMDREHWGDPETFRPERFIDSEGRLQTDPWFLPFGSGHRQCLAMNMAHDTLFIFLSVLLQNLTFSLPLGAAPPTTTGVDGFTIATAPFNAVVTPRTEP